MIKIKPFLKLTAGFEIKMRSGKTLPQRFSGPRSRVWLLSCSKASDPSVPRLLFYFPVSALSEMTGEAASLVSEEDASL
ncbi:Uncharacterized protein DAT39_016106 [Clarias magur]|uniref:Uncharacterized protein n=1 Tax=Clarias magur TaxID=1594786 RepID=A0A8J4UAG5_CLAMG|nr:Uncharacterized protein DAT39_016106 [Clarias magur]